MEHNPNVWGNEEYHHYHINISNKISRLFKELWDDKNVPEEYKLVLGQEKCFKVIRLPWFNVAILDGSIMSLNQLDDILDATNIANEKLAKMVDDVREEFAKNPTTNDKPYGKVLQYYKNSSEKIIKKWENKS